MPTSFCDLFNWIILGIVWVCRGSIPSFGRLHSWEINEQIMSLYFSVVLVKSQLVKATASLSPSGQWCVTRMQSLWSDLCLLHGYCNFPVSTYECPVFLAGTSSLGHPHSSLKPLQYLGSVRSSQAKLAEGYSEGEWPSLEMMDRVLASHR